MAKPDALALADALEADRPVCGPDAKQAAAELRRLHAEVERLSAAMAATPAPAPLGWKLVPVEPTPEMLWALFGSFVGQLTAGERKRYAAMLAAAPEAATPAPAEPVAWGMLDKETGLILDVICPDEHESFEGDYTVPLFAAPVAQAEPRKPLTESALCREVCEYGPQSEDEETGFRDGFRAAERVHGIKEQA